jgi:uncharacterized Zn-binding protein involved in type VI secretion
MHGLVHKGSNHFANSTAPDVCKTPSPAGPVPIPYPIIISQSSDLANGTTTVKADGEMAAVKGCEYSMCTGDEAGTAGGVVSSTFKKEAKFILFSFDVKLDGKNACRFGDKMTMNHQNTLCMAGTAPTVVQVNDATATLQEMVNECELSTPKTEVVKGKRVKKDCMKLGRDKHECMEKKVQDHRAANPRDGKPPLEGERGYTAPKLGPNNTVLKPVPATSTRPFLSRVARTANRVAQLVKRGFPDNVANAIARRVNKGKKFPDGAILGKGGVKKFVDFKFPCPKGHPSGRGKSKGGVKTSMDKEQQAEYDTLGMGTGNGRAITIRALVAR